MGELKFPGQVFTPGQPTHKPTQDFKITEDSGGPKFILLWAETITGCNQQLLLNVCRTVHVTRHSQGINIVPVDLQQLTMLVQLYPSTRTVRSPLAVPRESETSRSGCKLCSHLFLAS